VRESECVYICGHAHLLYTHTHTHTHTYTHTHAHKHTHIHTQHAHTCTRITASIRAVTTATWPIAVLQCSAVRPSLSAASVEAPVYTKMCVCVRVFVCALVCVCVFVCVCA